MTLFQEVCSEIRKVGDPFIILIAPKEGMTMIDFTVGICKVLRVHTVTDHKDLDITKKPSIGVLAVSLDLIERFNEVQAPTFELDLHQRQTINQKVTS